MVCHQCLLISPPKESLFKLLGPPVKTSEVSTTQVSATVDLSPVLRMALHATLAEAGHMAVRPRCKQPPAVVKQT